MIDFLNEFIGRITMNKLLILALLSILAISSNAEEIKQSKSSNKKELSKEDEEFMKQWQQLDQRQQEAKGKTQALDKLEKTVDELGNKLGVDKK